MGMVLAFRLTEETGCSLVRIFNVYDHVCKAFAIEELWPELETQDLHLDNNVIQGLQGNIRKVIERAMHWFLTRESVKTDDLFYADGIAELKQSLSLFMTDAGNQRIDERVDILIKQAVPAALALNIVTLDVLYLCLDAIWLNKQSDHNLKDCAQVLFGLIRELDLFWIREKISLLPEKTVWESLARRTVRDEFNSVSCSLSLTALEQDGVGVSEKISNWLAYFDKPINRYRRLLALVHTDDEIELEKITVLLKELRSIGS